MSDRPEVEQWVWLRDATGAGYDTRVLALDGEFVVLERPADYPAFVVPQQLELLWPVESGLFQMEVAITADTPEWNAAPLGEAGPAQRRAHARIAVETPMVLVCGPRTIQGDLADVSERGLRMRLRHGDTCTAETGTPVHVDVTLDDEGFVLDGTVLRVEEHPGGTEVVVVFEAAGETLRRLRRSLFFELVRLDAIGG